MRGAVQNRNRVQRQSQQNFLNEAHVEKFIDEKVKSVKYAVPQDENKKNSNADEELTDKVDEDEDVEAAY